MGNGWVECRGVRDELADGDAGLELSGEGGGREHFGGGLVEVV